MEFELLGWPPDGPQLRLDHERFSYAGKFVMTNTGKAVARADGMVVAAVAFNADRTDERTLWLRYVTVAGDRRGDGIGPDLVAFVRDRALEREYDRLRIAVNNPFAYEALYRAGFAYTGEETGIAELVLEHPREEAFDDDSSEEATATSTETPDSSRARYQAGLEAFRERDLSDAEEGFLADRRGEAPPEPSPDRSDLES